MQTLYHDAMAMALAARKMWAEQMELDLCSDDWQIAARNYAAAGATIQALQPFVNRESFENDKRNGKR